MVIEPKMDRLIKRTTMIGAATAAYFLLIADYGPQENALTQIERAMESAKFTWKKIFFGPDKETWENHQTPPEPRVTDEDGKEKAKADSAT